MRARMIRLLLAQAAWRRDSIAQAWAQAGADVAVEGEMVRASAPGLARRWWRDMELRDAGRGRI